MEENMVELPKPKTRFQIIVDGVVHDANARLPIRDQAGKVVGVEFIEVGQNGSMVHGIALNCPFQVIDYSPTIVSPEEFIEEMEALDAAIINAREESKKDPAVPPKVDGYM